VRVSLLSSVVDKEHALTLECLSCSLLLLQNYDFRCSRTELVSIHPRRRESIRPSLSVS